MSDYSKRLTVQQMADLFDIPEEKVLLLMLWLYHFSVIDLVLNVYENGFFIEQRPLKDGPPPNSDKYRFSFGVKAFEA